MFRFLVLMWSLVLAGCVTTNGIPAPWALDNYPWDAFETTHPICLMVGPRSDLECQGPVADHFEQFGMRVTYPVVVDADRPGLTIWGMSRDLKSRYIPEQCDRIMTWVGRAPGDFVYDLASLRLPLGSVYGWVDDMRLRGYVFTEFKGPAHLVASAIANGPHRCADVIHEVEHMLGCNHGLTKADCYQRLYWTKVNTEHNRLQGIDFTPGHLITGVPCWTRTECDAHAAILYGWEDLGRESR